MANWEQYWTRVSQNVCTDCGNGMMAEGKRRCQDCIDRVKEYNKNRRGELVRTTATPKQMRKATLGILHMTQLAKEDVEAYNK